MINSRQRSELRALANGADAIFQIGKAGVTSVIAEEISDALKARELVKITVLKTAEGTMKEIMEEVCAATGADPVSVCGRKLVIYKAPDDRSKAKIKV